MTIKGSCACGSVRFTIEGTPSGLGTCHCSRSFCRACGTALGEPLSPDESFPINAQCLDSDPGIKHSFQEFTEDRPVWDVPSDLPRDTHSTQKEAIQ